MQIPHIVSRHEHDPNVIHLDSRYTRNRYNLVTVSSEPKSEPPFFGVPVVYFAVLQIFFSFRNLGHLMSR